MVFAVDFHQCCAVTIGGMVLLAAPHGDDGVFGSMQQEDEALVGGCDLFCADSCFCPLPLRGCHLGGLMKGVPSQTPRVYVNDADACKTHEKRAEIVSEAISALSI